MPENKTIEEIIAIEWDMFQDVNAGTGVRADCQEDSDTFVGMRRSQFTAWDDASCKSYLKDLQKADNEGRNLVLEKYIHMMKNTDPLVYGPLMHEIHQPSDEVYKLALKITSRMIAATDTLRRMYPRVAEAGRPLYSADDRIGDISVETYLFGELLTYSEKTLKVLTAHIDALEIDGKTLAEEILTQTVRYYGYGSIREAERAQVFNSSEYERG